MTSLGFPPREMFDISGISLRYSLRRLFDRSDTVYRRTAEGLTGPFERPLLGREGVIRQKARAPHPGGDGARVCCRFTQFHGLAHSS
jgi:hypothetical protein